MAKALSNWDSLNLAVTIGSHSVTGYADGSMIEIVPDSDAWVTTVDSDGHSDRHKTNNTNFTVTITLKQSSSSNDVLSTFYNVDQQVNTGSFPITIIDMNGTSVISSLGAYVDRVADANMGMESTDRVWQLKLTNTGYFVGGY